MYYGELMTKTLNVAQFATELNLPVKLLLEQLQAAGMVKQEGDYISTEDKLQLLAQLRQHHRPPRSVSLGRQGNAGKMRTIDVEVRKRKVQNNRMSVNPTPSTVAQFATELNLPVALLLEQLQAAGMDKQEGDYMYEADGEQLLAHLNASSMRNIDVTVRKRKVQNNKTPVSPPPSSDILLKTDNSLRSRVEIEGETQTRKHTNKTYAVDGNNVCWLSRPPSIQPLLTVLIAILENGDDFYCVFDASIAHKLGGVDAPIIERLLKEQPKRFYRVTGSTSADGAILHDADHYNRSIITNDLYSKYVQDYPWLSERYTQRLVQCNLQPSGLMTIEKLPYGRLSLHTDTQLAFSRLNKLLAVRNVP